MYTVLDTEGQIQTWYLSWDESAFLHIKIISQQRDWPVRYLSQAATFFCHLLHNVLVSAGIELIFFPVAAVF